MTRTYWAAVPTDEIGASVASKVASYENAIGSIGRAEIWRRAARGVYGLDIDGGDANALAVAFGGSDGEIVQLRANYFAMFVRTLTVMCTGVKPTFQARPRAYDARTTEYVGIANAILDNYLDRGVDETLSAAMMSAIMYGEGWIGTYWDPQLGEVITPEPSVDETTGETTPGTPVPEGDIRVEIYTPDMVIRDPSVASWDHCWLAVRRRRSRWDLAADYPAFAETILNAPSMIAANSRESMIRTWGVDNITMTFDDTIDTIEFWHKPTRSIPQGRAAIIVAGTAIADGPNPYGRLPIRWIVPRPEPGMAFGYGETNDLLALQSMLDSAITIAASIEENFGMQSVVSPPGSMIETEALSKGMRALYASQVIEPLNSVGKGIENAIAFADYVVRTMQQVVSMNDVALGAGSSSASGASVQAQLNIVAQNNSGKIKKYMQVYRDVLTDIIRVLQQFATTERVVQIAGKNNAGKIARWKGETLSAIDGVDVELTGTASRTQQGRYQFMADLLAAGLITDPEVALQVYSTGRVEPLFDGPATREANIERENERLSEGSPVLVLPQDHHMDHIRRHSLLLFDPMTRDDPERVAIVQAHIHEHNATWRMMSDDPTLMGILMATGQQPLPPIAPPMPVGPDGAPVDPTQNPEVADATTSPAAPDAVPESPDARANPVAYQ